MSREQEYLKIILDLKEWHENKVSQLKPITELPEDHKIMVKGKEDDEQIEMPQELIKGFKLGVSIALESLGKFPLEITKSEKEETE